MQQPLGREWAVLELLARCSDAEQVRGELTALLTDAPPDWGELLEQALRHQLLPLLAHAVIDAGLRHELPLLIYLHLEAQLELNRWRVEVFRREAARVAAALSARGVRCAATKGITFESTLYGGLGVRGMKDVDFMIAPGDREAVAQALVELGFEESYEWARDPRREQISLRLNPDHLPTYRRATGQPAIPWVHVDFANSLTWSRSPFDVPVELALQDLRGLRVGDLQLPCFAPVFQLLFTVLHLFREAWLRKFVDTGNDVTLLKFSDVRRLVERDPAAWADGAVLRVSEPHQLTEPVAWVLSQLDAALGTATLAAVGLAGRGDEAWLAERLAAPGYTGPSRGSMRERLKSKRRSDLFEEPP